ncbi:MAG: OmpA family protein [Flavobacteriales bacterium]
MFRSLIVASLLFFANGTAPLVYEPDTFISSPDTKLFFAENYGDIVISWAPGKTEPIIKPSKTAPVEIVSTDPKRFNSLEGLARVLKNNSFLQLEIGCHTDAAEKPSINEELSYKRAKRIKQLLIGLGVDSLQLRAIGYGGSIVDKWYTKSPLKTFSRKVELRITGRKDKPLCGMNDTVVLPMQKLRMSYSFEFNNMDHMNVMSRTENSTKTMDSIVAFMNKNLDANILIVSYTDLRGGSGMNAILGRKRAENIASHIVSGGINAKRITCFGAGEWNPLVDLTRIKYLMTATELSKANHANSRIEIVIDMPVTLK